MNAILITIAAMTVGGDDALAKKAAPAPRAHYQIRRDISSAMRREATAQSLSDRAAAIRDLAAVFNEVKRDPRLETSDTLKGFKARMRSRLQSVKEDLEKDLERKNRQGDKRNSSRRTVASGRLSDGDLLGGASPSAAPSQEPDVITASLAAQLDLFGSMQGGPAQFLSDSNGAFGGRPIDDGWALVELIQRTIAPDFWDVNGGPGSIFYYQPLRVLVVRATSEVHHSIGGVVGGLRRAGN